MATARLVAAEVRAIHEADVGRAAAERHDDHTAPFDVPQIVIREIHRDLPSAGVQLTEEQTIRGAVSHRESSVSQDRFA